MKEALKLPVKEVILLGVISIVFIFIINALFLLGFSGNTGMISAAGEVYEAVDEKGIITENVDRMETIVNGEAPEIRYVSRSFKAGEEFQVKDLFEVRPAGASNFIPAADESSVIVSVQDIRDEDGNSYMPGTQEDDGTSEELPAVAFNRSTGMICFNQSGVFLIRVLVWGENGRNVLGEIALPVEAG